MLIAQITDCHIVEPGMLLADRVDTAAGLRNAIAHVHGLHPTPDLVLATGDLVNDGTPAQYDHLLTLMATLEVPFRVIPGNHDDRQQMRAAFPAITAPGGPEDRLDTVVEGYDVRLIGLDTTIPGEHGGRIEPEHMVWLDGVLAQAPDRPTIIFQHHPPFRTGITWMDDVGLAGADLEAAVLAAHDQVQAVICGHIHRPITTLVGSRLVSVCPSTGAQVALSLDGHRYTYVDEVAAICLHHWEPGVGLRSHVSQVPATEQWKPPWASEEA